MNVRNVIGAVVVTCAILALPNCGKKETKEKTEQVEQKKAGLWGRNNQSNKKYGYRNKESRQYKTGWWGRTQKRWSRWWNRSEDKRASDICFRETSQDYYDRVNGACPYCNKKFKTPRGLRRHVSDKHPVELKKDIK